MSLVERSNEVIFCRPNGNLIGALDMGGSSTQLVFHKGTNPNERVQPEDFW